MVNDDAPAHTPPRDGRTARQHELQALILAQATTLFAERGFEGVRVVDVAERAGTSKGSVLYHFHSKEDLWISACEKAVADFEAAMAVAEIEPTYQGFAEVHRRFMQACVESPAYIRISALETMMDTWRARWIGERYMARHVRGYRQLVDRLQQAGALPEIDPLVLQAMFAGGYQLLVGQAAMVRSAVGRNVTTPEFIDSYLAAMERLVSNR